MYAHRHRVCFFTTVARDLIQQVIIDVILLGIYYEIYFLRGEFIGGNRVKILGVGYSLSQKRPTLNNSWGPTLNSYLGTL